MTKKLLLTFVLFAGLSISAFAQENARTVSDVTGKSSAELAKEYAGKPLVVRGTVTYTGPDRYGLPSIDLSGGDQSGISVLCVLPYSGMFDLGSVKIGQEVTVSGEYRSIHDDKIILKQCTVVR